MITVEEQLKHAKARYAALEADFIRMKTEYKERVRELEVEHEERVRELEVEHEERVRELEDRLAKLETPENIYVCTRCQKIITSGITYSGCTGSIHRKAILCVDCYKDHLMCDSCSEPICAECHYDRLCESCREDKRSRDRN